MYAAVLRLVSAGRIIELPDTPFLLATLPYNCIFTYLFEGCQYAAFNRGATAVSDRGEAATELLVDQVVSIILSQLAILLDD